MESLAGKLGKIRKANPEKYESSPEKATMAKVKTDCWRMEVIGLAGTTFWSSGVSTGPKGGLLGQPQKGPVPAQSVTAFSPCFACHGR